jgi:hypothetical protein
MESQEKGLVKKVSKQNNQKQRKGIIAVGTVFVVACAFSYLVGAQQQTGRFSPMFASANGNQYVQSSAQNTTPANVGGNLAYQNPAITNNQPAQDNSNSGADNLSQSGGRDDSANQGMAGSGVNAQGSSGDGSSFSERGYGEEGSGEGFGRHEGGRGRHGGGFAEAGNSGGTIAQNGGPGNFQSNNSGVTGTYSGNIQRCCATGKTGTCHS